MKKIFITSIIGFYLSMASFPALANSRVCQITGELSRTIMEDRQSGKPLLDVVEQIEDAYDVEVTDTALNLFTTFAIKAYNTPVASGEEAKEKVIDTFANSIVNGCQQIVGD